MLYGDSRFLIADSRTEKYEYLRIWKAEKKMSTDFDVWNRIMP